jgi:outer membrane immunogenic protein
MKKILLTTVLLASLGSVAQAADLPRKSPQLFAPAMPMFTWSGFHIGINGGYAFGDGNTATTGTPVFQTLIAPGIVPDSLRSKPDGFMGGFQAGYNAQFGALVAGIEADIQFGNLKSRSSFTGGPVLGTQLTTSATTELSYLGTARARLGFTPAERLLVYATGGLAFGEVKTGGAVNGVQAPGLVWQGSKSETKLGYAIGMGAEYALTNNLTFKGEYLYYDLGKTTINALGNPAVRGVAALNGIDYQARTQNSGSLVRAGVNYKF